VENQATVTATDACDGVTEITAISEIIEVTLIHPELEVTKVVLTPEVDCDEPCEFEITIANTGDVDLDITTDEPGIMPFRLGWDEPPFVTIVTIDCTCPPELACNQITVVGTIPPEYCELPNEVVEESAEVCFECHPPGTQGCTPGYWKNNPECWECFDPEDRVCDVFDVPAELHEEFCDDDDTLMDAMNFTGGGKVEGAARNLLRHAVAAILNACDADIAYPMTVDEVINAVNAALATLDRGEIEILKNMLDEYNNYGCPQDAHCNPIEPEDGF
jgi:hypothetical protein